MAPKEIGITSRPQPPSKGTTASTNNGNVDDVFGEILEGLLPDPLPVKPAEQNDDSARSTGHFRVVSDTDISSSGLADIESHDGASMGGKDSQLSQGGQFGDDK